MGPRLVGSDGAVRPGLPGLGGDFAVYASGGVRGHDRLDVAKQARHPFQRPGIDVRKVDPGRRDPPGDGQPPRSVAVVQDSLFPAQGAALAVHRLARDPGDLRDAGGGDGKPFDGEIARVDPGSRDMLCPGLIRAIVRIEIDYRRARIGGPASLTFYGRRLR